MPEYWNASIIILILGSLLRKQNGNARDSLPVDGNIIPITNKETMVSHLQLFQCIFESEDNLLLLFLLCRSKAVIYFFAVILC